MKIQHKRSAALDGDKAKEPTAAQTDFGEVCVNFNTQDPALFIRDNADNIVRVGGDLSLYQKIEDTPPPVFVCAPDEINAQSPPADRLEGTLWWNTVEGILYVWYIDENSSQWVIAVPQTSLDDVPPGTVVGETPPSGAEEGQLWWNSDASENGGGRLYVYYDNHWVDTSVPGSETSYLTTEEANNSYLKLDASNDPVTGVCEFAAGVSVTGGTFGAESTTPDQLHIGLSSFDGQLFLMSNGDPDNKRPITFQIGGKTQCAINSLGRFNGNWDNKFDTETLIGFQTTGLTYGDADTTKAKKIISYRADGGIDNNFAGSDPDNSYPRQNIEGYGFFAGSSYGRNNGISDQQRQANRLKTYAGFATDTISNAADTVYGFYSSIFISASADQYNFYAQGTAPNYFAGITRVSGSPDDGVSPQLNSGSDQSGVEITTDAVNIGSRNTQVDTEPLSINRYGTGIAQSAPWIGLYQAGIRRAYINCNGGLGTFMLDERAIVSSEDVTSATAVIQNITPKRVTDADGNQQLGFIAHELQAHLADAVTGTRNGTEPIGTLTDWDGTELETDVVEPENLTYEEEVEATPYVAAVEATYDEYGNELTAEVPEVEATYTTVTRTRSWNATGTRDVYQGVDQTKLIPLLTKALQEVMQKNEDLEARIAALEGA